MARFEQIILETDRTYGQILVLGPVLVVQRHKSRVTTKVRFHCLCSCGTEFLDSGRNISCGKKESCGCLYRNGVESGAFFDGHRGYWKGKSRPSQSVLKTAESNRGQKRSKRTKRKMSQAARARMRDKSTRNRVSSAVTRSWSDPSVRKNRLDGMSLARKASRKGKGPNAVESRLLEILESVLPGQYRYTGDWSFTIDRLNPDFLHGNGKKKVIELFGEKYHDPGLCIRPVPESGTEDGRRKRMTAAGYEMLVVWSKEIYWNGRQKKKIAMLHKKIIEFNSL